MSNKTKFLFDRNDYKDTARLFDGRHAGDTDIIFSDPQTHEQLFVLHNKVVIAGSQFTAMKHFDMPELVHFPTYNESLTLDNSVSHGITPTNVPKICLFACGTDGCGTENSQVYPEKYTGRINPNGDPGLIPFRYQLANNDLTAEQRKIYFGRKSTSSRIAYYFKAFNTTKNDAGEEVGPQMYARYTDGTIIDEHVYESSNKNDAEFYVELSLSITKEDFRDYFRVQGGGINAARINSISLLTAWYTEAGGYKWYQDINPMTQLNIPNEPLIDLTKGIDITYHIYY